MPEPIMTPAEVAEVFHVDPRTVTRWANQGRISSFRTPGGHRRFLREEVEALRKKTSRDARQEGEITAMEGQASQSSSAETGQP